MKALTRTQKIKTPSNEGAYLLTIYSEYHSEKTNGCVNWCNVFFVILLWFHCHLIAILLSFLVSILVEYFLDTYSCIYSFILSTNTYWVLTMYKVFNLCYRDTKMNMSQPLSSKKSTVLLKSCKCPRIQGRSCYLRLKSEAECGGHQWTAYLAMLKKEKSSSQKPVLILHSPQNLLTFAA